VNKDKLTLFDLVCLNLQHSIISKCDPPDYYDWGKEVDFVVFLVGDFVQVSKMEMYLTTTDHIVRSRGPFISFPCCGYCPSCFLEKQSNY
jgi:hypothetical protein